jgi:hypothetical protein
MFAPSQPSSKLPLIFLSLNFIISLTSTAIFSILYHNKYSIPYIFPIFSFLYTVISIAISLLFERSDVAEGSESRSNRRIVPHIKDEKNDILIELKTTTFTLNEPSSCTICLEEFIQDEIVNETNCGHFYHKNCMEKILNNKIKNCPVCRADLYERNQVVIV